MMHTNKNTFKFFSANGEIKLTKDATVSLFSVEYTYGFGVYESIRVVDKRPRFLGDHALRLFESAQAIGLEHWLTVEQVEQYICDLVAVTDIDTYNLKILLLGGVTPESAQLYILPLMPHYPDRSLYKKGAQAITVKYERYLPHAKSLNMLPSYLAYREARRMSAYDALLVNDRSEITEGTRTNFFQIHDKVIVTPPSSDVLEGVTRKHVIEVARRSGFEVVERPLMSTGLLDSASYFITSTSTKIMPLRQIDDQNFTVTDNLRQLMGEFNNFLRQG